MRLESDGSECNLNHMLFADNTTLVADSQGRLRQLVEKLTEILEGV